MEGIIPRENVRWLKQQLEACTEDGKREQLQRLLAVAEARLEALTRR